MSSENIYGIGLPRTGTRSLASALRTLGYTGTNICMLTKEADKDEVIQGNTFNVNNAYFLVYRTLYLQDAHSKYILTTRNKKDWIDSLDTISHKNSFPDIYEYNKEVVDFFETKLSKLLVIDVFEDKNPWETLCNFLEKDIPNNPFPHIT